MEPISRPKTEETDEDLLHMQEEFRKARLKGTSTTSLSVNIKKMTNKTNPMPSKDAVNVDEKSTVEKQPGALERAKLMARKRAGRFTLDLDVLEEENTAQVLFGVQEKNLDYLDGTNEKPFRFVGLSDEYSKDEGFPDVLDLSRYFIPDKSGQLCVNPKDGRSLFAVEFDRLNGKIDVGADEYFMEPSTTNEESEDEDAVSRENTKRIEQMSKEELLNAQREIVERFDPKIIEFLRKRSQKKTSKTKMAADIRKESRFKQIREMGEKLPDDYGKKGHEVESADTIVEEKVKELEVFPTKVDGTSATICGDDKDSAYTRLAVEAVQLDFATKCLRKIIPRQQQNLLRLFDSFAKPLGEYEEKDELLEMARTNLPAIKGLYLEEINSEKGVITYQFAGGLNPITDGAWTLLPIRNVLDTYQKDFQITVEDVVIVRLCMLWTLLMLTERGSLFYMCNTPEDVYVRLAEIFLIGPEVFKDDVVKGCADRILRCYVVPKAKLGSLKLIATEPIAKLDAFMPFYEDLMRHFEEFAVGDELFSLILLVGAYMNSALLDSMMTRCAIWSPERKIVRQITLAKELAEFLLQHLASTREYWNEEMEAQYYAQYSQLLAMYAAAIRNDEVTRDRNPLVFEIAATELGYFAKRHCKGGTQSNSCIDGERIKEFDILVDIIRSAVAGKLEL